MTKTTDTLQKLSSLPLEKEAFEAWLKLEDAIEFLENNARQDEFVVYAGMTHVFMHAVVVPASSVNPPNVDDLISWSCNPTSSWGISYTFSDPASVQICPPLEHTGSKTLDKGEQLVFARFFEGRLGSKNYYEALQRFIHVFDLHYLRERSAYCRLDKHGDIEDMICNSVVPAKEGFAGNIVTFSRELLDEYLTLTSAVIVRMFDFTRFRPSSFNGWSNAQEASYTTTDGEFSYRSRIEPGHASYMRGYQIVRPLGSKLAILKRLSGITDEEKQYASYIAHDWKNNVVREISCAPGHAANYFTKSDLPFELSPAFFRPEVLAKYKADSEKYRLTERSISCRGAWHLETYDINEAGQVHSYLVYLRNLPYEEQLHWKAYNENPRGPISRRAFTTDFEGSWDLEYDPLISLKGVLRDLDQRQVPWWTLRTAKLLDQVHYPATSSADEWSNEILQLDQLVVEGFEEKYLKQKAQELGRTPDPKFRSLKLVEECLIALGFEEEHARKITAPLQEVHHLRSKLKGHASGEEAQELKRKALENHQSYRNHFHHLCRECDQVIKTIVEAFGEPSGG